MERIVLTFLAVLPSPLAVEVLPLTLPLLTQEATQQSVVPKVTYTVNLTCI